MKPQDTNVIPPRNDLQALGGYDKIQDPNTPKFNTTTGQPTDYGKSLGLSSVSASNLTPSIPLKVSNPIIDTSNSAINGSTASNTTISEADKLASDTQAKIDTEKATNKTLMDSLIGVNTDVGNVNSTVDRTAQNNARLTADQYTNQIEAEQKSLQDKTEQIRATFGGTTAGAEAAISKITRESLNKQADLALLQNAANRNYTSLSAVADEQVKNNLAALTAKAENIKLFYEDNKSSLTKDEQTLLTLQMNKVNAELKKKADAENAIASMKMEIAKSQDPNKASLISTFSQIDTSDPKAVDKALAIYSQIKDPSIQLDLAIKKANLVKLQKETSLLGEPTATEKKQIAADLKSAKSSIPATQDKIDAVDTLLEHSGMDSRVGTSFFTRTGVLGVQGIADKLSGSGQQFAGGIHKLTSGLSLDSLIDAKARGATFGALSDREMNILSSAATKLADWEEKDKNGIGKGYWNIDEESFKAELKTIQDLSRRALLLSQGTILSQDEQSLLNNTFSSDNMALDPSNYYNQ